MRLFIAIMLSDEIRKSVTAAMHDLKKQEVRGNYVPIQNLHLTLAFIGETRESEKVREALRSVKMKPFRMTMSEMGTFGDLLWVGIKGNQKIAGAAKSVRDALDAAGIPYDRKKFTPHITIIRQMNGKWQQVPAPKGEMVVTKLSLMKSTEKDGKPVYTEIDCLQLEG